MSDSAILPKPAKRKPLTRVQFATLILKQEGRCGCGCGKKLVADQIIDEHLQPLDALGANDLTNRALFDRDCAARKTQGDRAARDKGRRIRGEVGNGPKRKIAARGFAPPLIETRPSRSENKWQSAWKKPAGFKRSAKLVRGVDGKVRERT